LGHFSILDVPEKMLAKGFIALYQLLLHVATLPALRKERVPLEAGRMDGGNSVS
jgi:hypothetical protein